MSKLGRAVLCCLVLCGSTWQAKAQLITNSPNLPPSAGAYVSPAMAHQLYNMGALSVEVINIKHHYFSNSFPPPPDDGAKTSHGFGSVLDGDLIINGGAPQPFSASAQVSVNVTKTTGPNGSPLGTYATQMTQLDITGLPGGAEIRVDPTTPSLGQTTISDAGGGNFRIDSFFDIFTDLSLDGGTTWTPSTGPGHVSLQPNVPEPSTLTFLMGGLMAGGGFARRRMRRA